MSSPVVSQDSGEMPARISFPRSSSIYAMRSRTTPSRTSPRTATLRRSPRGTKRRADEMDEQQHGPQRRSSRSKKKSPPSNLKAPPPAAKASGSDENEADKKPAAVNEAELECSICFSNCKLENWSQINGCDHRFCFNCIERWSEQSNTCPLCKKRFTKIERVCKKRKKGVKMSKKCQQRDLQIEQPRFPPIEALIARITEGGFPAALAARIMVGLAPFPGGPPGAIAANAAAGSSANNAVNLLDSDDEDDNLSPFFRQAAPRFSRLNPAAATRSFSRTLRSSAGSNGASAAASSTTTTFRFGGTLVVPYAASSGMHYVRRARSTNANEPGSSAGNAIEIDMEEVD